MTEPAHHSGTTGQTDETTAGALCGRQALLLAALLAGLLAPGITIWLMVLWQRPLVDNAPQLITAAFLIMFVLQKKRDGELNLRLIQPSLPGMGLIAVSGLVYLLGIWLSIKAAIFSGILLILAAICYTWLGRRAFKTALPAFLFALFLLPQFPTDIRTAISLPLQLASTKLATALASVFITIQTQGNIFYVKGEAFEVTAACSGLNTWVGYLFAGMLAMLMGYFSWGRLARLLVGAPLLALGGNAIRLWITAMVAYWFSGDTAIAIHTNLEYAIFPLGLLIMALAERQINRWMTGKQPTGQSAVSENTVIENPASESRESESPEIEGTDTLQPQHSETAADEVTPTAVPDEALSESPKTASMATRRTQLPATLLWGTAALLLLLNIGAWLGNGQPQTAGTPAQNSSELPSVPYQVGAWHGKELPLLHDEAAILAPATVTSRAYTIGTPQPGQPLVWMNLLEAPSMNALHNVVDSLIASGAQPKLKGTIVIDTRKGPLKASWFLCRDRNNQPYHLLLWYEWDGGTAENRWVWYWNVLQMKLQRRQPIWRLVELAAPGSPSEAGPEQSRKLEQLKSFAAEIYPASVP